MARTFGDSSRGAIVAKAARFIERNYGYHAVPYSAVGETHYVPFLSLKLYAEMAGLGRGHRFEQGFRYDGPHLIRDNYATGT